MSSNTQSKDICDGQIHSKSPVLGPSRLDAVSVDDHRNDRTTEGISKPKRNACIVCRKKKLRCDGGQPSCDTCTRLKHDCAYKDGRRKSGPRRGYVRSLETRLAQIEGLLKKQDGVETSKSDALPMNSDEPSNIDQFQFSGFGIRAEATDHLMSFFNILPDNIQSQSDLNPFPHIIQDDAYTLPSSDPYEGFSWAMIELGVDEPLPLQEIIDDLNEIYFTKVHPSYPMIHQGRFLAAMNLSPRTRPSVALRYAMWALAASITARYKDLHTHFYSRARKYAELDEMTGRHKYITVRHAQAWLLIATYEFKMMHFPHAWLTTGRATRLTQMMGLHRLDGIGLDVKQSLPACIDWIEKEERRRTFWTAFCKDRYASIGTGWPMIVDERDIITNLPCSEEYYAQNNESVGISLVEAMRPQSASGLSSFAGVIVIASLSGQTLLHLQRPSLDDNDENLNGEFWKAHRKMDSVLLNTSLYLPSHLRLPAGSSNSNIIFLNMSLHATTICVHQAAMFKAEKLELSASIISESSMRCLAAATEIATIMRLIAHMDLSTLNVYTPFILYLAVRVLARVAKTQTDDDSAKSSALFLLSALIAMKEAIPLAEIYIIQLDLEGTNLATLQESAQPSSGLEKGVADISITDEIDDASWVTFVSPLVRICEQTGGSNSIATSPPSARDEAVPEIPTTGQNFTTRNTAPISSSSMSSAMLDNSVLYPEQQPYVGDIPDLMDIFPGTGAWDFGDTTMSTGLFDSLMETRPNR